MNKKSLKLPAICITVVSIGILIGILVLKKDGYTNEFLETIVYPLIEMLCSISITAAIGTYLIEWKGFVEYVQQKLSEILSKPDMVKNLDSTYQSKLLSQLIYEQTSVKSKSFDGFMYQFYSELKHQAETFGFYLLEQTNRVKCRMYKESGQYVTDDSGIKYRILIHTRTITYGLLTESSVTIKNILSVNVTDKMFKDKPTVEVTSVKIGSKRLDRNSYTVECRENVDVKNIDTLYKKSYVCELVNSVKIYEGLKIEVSYISYEPITDFSYCTRMKYFCKRFKMDFSYDPAEFNVYAQAITFGARKNQTIEADTIAFDIDDWLMPGEGTNIFIGGR